VLKEFEESASFCERRREENNTRPPFQHQTDVNQQPRHNFRRDNNNRYQPRTPVQESAVPRPVTQINVSGNADEARA